jgi:hypothetical protein
MVERDYQVAGRYFSYEILEEKLLHLIRAFGSLQREYGLDQKAKLEFR